MKIDIAQHLEKLSEFVVKLKVQVQVGTWSATFIFLSISPCIYKIKKKVSQQGFRFFFVSLTQKNFMLSL